MPTETISDKFARLANELDSELAERSAEIQCALLALVSGTSFFMVGEPGIAKSMLVQRMHARIADAEYFDLDLDRFTTPDDLFGPRSLAAMKEDRWERQIDGSIITADYAFLDEIFEASGALLKALLRTMNERTYRQGTEIIPMRLTTLYAASNVVPTDPRLAAVYDRLLIRRQLHRIRENSSFISMLDTDRDPKPEAVLTWADVQQAQEAARRVVIPQKLLGVVADIRTALADAPIEPSDRRFAEALKVVRAAAYLDDCTTATPEHLRCLADILWVTPEQYPVVHEAIAVILEPMISAIDGLLAEVTKIRKQIDPNIANEDQRKVLAAELGDKLTAARNDLRELAKTKGRDVRTKRQFTRCEALIKDTTKVLLRDMYGRTLDD